MSQPIITPYEILGGEPFFAALTAAFYRQVATDPILRPMYPEDDLEPARRRLQLFLEQYWGGPTTYSDERGHPRLRKRHMEFTIDEHVRDRWLQLMRVAVAEQHLPDEAEDMLWSYLLSAAFAMQNTSDESANPEHGHQLL